MVAGSQGYRFEPVMLKRMVRVLAHCIGEFGENSGAECGHFSVANKWFLRHLYDLKLSDE
ncbi:TonB-dependent receptor plug domain protein [Pseudomonas sp. StFLB209]|nr:TonB-dependent receptor plug domain protein [Pseudomonas sp. StFLB209]